MAITNKTYNNLIDKLKDIGNKHEQISTVTVGDIFDIDLEKNTKYALMHINPVNVVTARYGLTYNFQIFVMDLVEPDNSNEQQVYSTVLQICVDLISIFRNMFIDKSFQTMFKKISRVEKSYAMNLNLPIFFS